jgi:glycosyltransferase involved in cell wall biosynthesis
MTTVSVALDVAPLHGPRTGVGIAVAQLLEALTARPDVDLHRYLVSFRARPQDGEHRLPLPAAVAQRTWVWWQRPRADRWLRRIDVVHGTNYVVPPTRLPSVVSVYDCWALAHPDAASASVRRAGRLARLAARNGATIVVNASATAARAGELLATSQVEVIPLGAPCVPPAAGDRRPSGAPPGPFVLALGTTERRKALGTLVTAFARVAGEVGDLALVVAGAPGDDEAAIDAATTALAPSVRHRVVRLGAVADAEKWWLLRQASALAYPSLDEGFGFPVLEAQAAGVPVVATRAGSIPEVGGDGVELVDVGDVDGLAAAIVTSVTDRARRETLVAAGRRNVARFDWGATAAAFAALYARLASAGRP